MAQIQTDAEYRKLEAERKHAEVMASQEAYEKMAGGIALTLANSCPPIPGGDNLILRRTARDDWMSLEWSQERVALAVQLPDLEGAAEVAAKKLANVTDQLEKATVLLKEAEARVGTNKDNVESRMALGQKVHVLGADMNRLAQEAAGARGQLSAAQAKIHDDLVKWAEARKAYAEAGIAFLTPLLAEASEILEAKASEVRTGKVHKGARSRAEIAKASQAPKQPLPSWLTDLGTARTGPRRV